MLRMICIYALCIIPANSLGQETADTPAEEKQSSLTLRLPDQQVKEIATKKDTERLIEKAVTEPMHESEVATEEKEADILDTLKKIQVSVDREGNPTVGYRFSEKSEAAKKAEREYLDELDPDHPLRQSTETTGQIIDGQLNSTNQ